MAKVQGQFASMGKTAAKHSKRQREALSRSTGRY